MTITIRNFRVMAVVGVSDVERSAEREIVLNVRMDYDASAAAMTDAIENAVDYRQSRDRIVKVISARPFHLIETIAGEVVKVLASDSHVTRVEVEVNKPGALRSCESVSAMHTWVRERAC